MRVVHVASGRLFGGIEQMLVTMARERFSRRRSALTFAVIGPGRLSRLSRLEDELRQIGADVLSLGDVRIRRPDLIVKARSVLRGALVALRPDAVVCHAPWAYALFAPVARRLRLPLVLLAARSGDWALARRTMGGTDEGRPRRLQQRVDV